MRRLLAVACAVFALVRCSGSGATDTAVGAGSDIRDTGTAVVRDAAAPSDTGGGPVPVDMVDWRDALPDPGRSPSDTGVPDVPRDQDGGSGRDTSPSDRIGAPEVAADTGADAADLAPPSDVGSSVPESFLMLGNSYTAYNGLVGLVGTALELGGAGPLVSEARTPGGYRLVQHLTDTAAASHPLYDGGLDAGTRWSFVVLQEQSQIPSFYPGNDEYDGSMAAAAGLARIAAERGATVVLFMTWGRRDGDTDNPALNPDFPTMSARLETGYRDMAAAILGETGVAPLIAPVGPAFSRVYDAVVARGEDPLEAGSAFHRLYSGDGSHPSREGTYLAACVIAETMMPALDLPSLALPSAGVTDAAYLRQVANEAVSAER